MLRARGGGRRGVGGWSGRGQDSAAAAGGGGRLRNRPSSTSRSWSVRPAASASEGHARRPASPAAGAGAAWAAVGLVTGAAAGAACAPSGEGTPAWGQVSRAGGRQPVAWLAQARGPLSCCKKPKTSQPCSWFEKRHTAQKRIT